MAARSAVLSLLLVLGAPAAAVQQGPGNLKAGTGLSVPLSVSALPVAGPAGALGSAPGAALSAPAAPAVPGIPALPPPAPGLAPAPAAPIGAEIAGPAARKDSRPITAADFSPIPAAPELPSRDADLSELSLEGRARFDGATARGPPTAAALDAVDAELGRLNGAGFAVLPKGALLSPAATHKVLEIVDRGWVGKSVPKSLWTLVDEWTEKGRDQWRTDSLQTPELIAEVKPFVEELTARLERVLPDGRVKIRNVQIRVTTGGEERTGGVKDLHVDGGYMTMTLALRGPGTDLYAPEPGGRLARRIAGTGETVIITGRDRDWKTNIPGTVHSTPAVEGRGRVLLLINMDRADLKYDKDAWPLIEARAYARVEAVVRRIHAAARARRPAPSKGLLSGLKKLLGLSE